MTCCEEAPILHTISNKEMDFKKLLLNILNTTDKIICVFFKLCFTEMMILLKCLKLQVDLQPVGTPVGMVTVSSVNLTNSLVTAVSQPAVFYPSTGTARLAQPTILKLSNASVIPSSAAHSPGQILVQTSGAPQVT